MLKNLRLVAIVIALVLGLAAFSACSFTKSTDESYFTFDYVEETDSYVISASSNQLPKTVFIPAEYNEKPVTAVKENGFSGANCFAVTDVVIRSTGALQIGTSAFAGLKNLRSVDVFASSVTVSDNAFEGCELLKEVNFKNELTSLSVGKYAFCGTGFESLTLNAEAVAVAGFAFADCKSLTLLTVNNATEFYATSVNGCTALKAIEVTGNYYSENGHVYADVEGVKTLVKYAPAAEGSVFVVTTAVGAYAFRNAVNLAKADLSGAGYVAEFAFMETEVADFGEFDSTEWAANWWVGSGYIPA